MPSQPPTKASGDSLLQAMSDAILAIASEPRLDPVLQKLVESAQHLVDARYAALGVPDEDGESFSKFIFTGMSDDLVANIGPLPRKHGLLAAMLSDARPYRARDIREDPRFEWWPDAHPRMTSFLGVPIVSKGNVIGAFYLSDKNGASEFTAEDQSTIEMLAAHAAVAIENARLYERSRELSVIEERNRLARELHDSVTQVLFAVALKAETAAALAETDPRRAKQEIDIVNGLARDAAREMRSLIFELRPAELEGEGFIATLEKHVDVLKRVYQREITFRDDGYEPMPPEKEAKLFRIVQESLNNAIKHSEAATITVTATASSGLATIVVSDDGKGFDLSAADLRSRRLGLTSMEERSEELGGVLTIDSSPTGTRVTVGVPLA